MNYPNMPQPGGYQPNPTYVQPGYAPNPNFAQPQQQFYPPQPGFAQPQPAAPAPVLARGTIEDYFSQPQMTGGGASVGKFFNAPGRPQGSWLRLRVKRDLTNADVRQQTTPDGAPQTYKDGTPKWVLIVPVQVLEGSDPGFSALFEGGDATVWVKGLLQEELSRAMAVAGDNSGVPKGGAEIIMASAGEKPARKAGYNASKLFQLQYAAPAVDPTVTTSAPVPVPASPTAGVVAPANPFPPANQAQYDAAAMGVTAPPVPASPPFTPPMPQAIPAPQLPQTVPAPTFQAPPPPPQADPGSPALLVKLQAPPPPPQADPDKAALLAKLQGGQG